MSIERKPYGVMPDGTNVEIIHLTNASGARLDVITYGCRVVGLTVPDRNGEFGDVVMGFENLEQYIAKVNFQGAAVGRYANRIGGAKFELDGKSYHLTVNEGKNQLHGGKGFAEKVWKVEKVEDGSSPAVTFCYLSVDGEEGYPGNLEAKITYTLTEDNAWKIDYSAVTDQKTVVNLTNHAFFNLAGYPCGDILDQELKLYASRYTPADEALIPTGEILPVAGTPLDFTQGKKIGQDIHGKGARVEAIGGYDHNFVLDKSGDGMEKAAEVYDPNSGRYMEVLTDLPGIQLFTANLGEPGVSGKGGMNLVPYYAICLETQFFPDSPNKPQFPSAVLEPGKEFHSTTVYQFGVK